MGTHEISKWLLNNNTSIMRCNNCGNQLSNGDEFCSKCGTPVNQLRIENVDETKGCEEKHLKLEYSEALKGFAYLSSSICFAILLFSDDSERRRIWFVLFFVVGWRQFS